MKAKAAVALLLVAALGIGVWYLAHPRPAPESLPLNPELTKGVELLSLRNPLTQSTVYPGIRLGDSTRPLDSAMRRDAIQFTTSQDLFMTSYWYKFRFSGRVLGMQSAKPLIVEIADNRGSLWLISVEIKGLTDDEARPIFRQWMSTATGILGPSLHANDCESGQSACSWQDGRSTLDISFGKGRASSANSLSIHFQLD